jgi:predicted  nucleic acid-binding Zn-ribbon protein
MKFSQTPLKQISQIQINGKPLKEELRNLRTSVQEKELIIKEKNKLIQGRDQEIKKLQTSLQQSQQEITSQRRRIDDITDGMLRVNRYTTPTTQRKEEDFSQRESPTPRRNLSRMKEPG